MEANYTDYAVLNEISRFEYRELSGAQNMRPGSKHRKDDTWWGYQRVGIYEHPLYGECIWEPISFPLPRSTFFIGNYQPGGIE